MARLIASPIQCWNYNQTTMHTHDLCVCVLRNQTLFLMIVRQVLKHWDITKLTANIKTKDLWVNFYPTQHSCVLRKQNTISIGPEKSFFPVLLNVYFIFRWVSPFLNGSYLDWLNKGTNDNFPNPWLRVFARFKQNPLGNTLKNLLLLKT